MVVLATGDEINTGATGSGHALLDLVGGLQIRPIQARSRWWRSETIIFFKKRGSQSATDGWIRPTWLRLTLFGLKKIVIL